MAYTNDLVELNGFTSEFNELDLESPDTYLRPDDFVNEKWPDKEGNLNTSPLLEGDWLNGFNTDQSGTTKLVSSEEDIMSKSGNNSPVRQNGMSHSGSSDEEKTQREIWREEVDINFNNHSVIQDMENYDGFASNDVITVGEYPYEEEIMSSPESNIEKSMADRWGSTEYDTVMRAGFSKEPTSNVSTVQIPNLPVQKPIEKKPSISTDENSCTTCNQKVYATEKLIINNLLFHRQCFKCAKCHRILSMNNFATDSGKMFCQTHFLEGFRQTGKYDVIDSSVSSKEPSAAEYDDNSSTTDTQNELPPPQTTKNIVSMFRQLESSNTVCETPLSKQRVAKNTGAMLWSRDEKEINQNKFSEADRQENRDKVNEELPAPGFTRNLLSLWNNLEIRSQGASGLSSGSVCGTPKRMTARSSSEIIDVPRYNPDIVRYDDQVEENFPPPHTTKSVAALFREMESNSRPPIPCYQSLKRNAGRQYVPPDTRIVTQQSYDDSKVKYMQDEFGDGGQESENTPITRPDVITGEQRNDSDEFPEVGSTRNLVGLWKSMQYQQ